MHSSDSDSKTASGVAEVPLTEFAVEAFRNRRDPGPGPTCFPTPTTRPAIRPASRRSEDDASKAGIPFFRFDDLRSTYATRLSAGGVADEWVTQLLRQGDAKVFEVLTDEAADETRSSR
jgi:integrase